jgi:peptidoglycan-associated lipoprotein
LFDPAKGGIMRVKLYTWLILLTVLPGFVIFSACSKKVAQPPAPVEQPAEDDSAAMLEQERLKKEAEERELRAEKIKFMYEDIYFKKGRYALTPEAKEILSRKAEWLHKHPEIDVVIEGHTDERGSKEFNIAFGDRRAGAVKSYLIGKGIARERMNAVSFGKEKPVDPSRTEAARAKNRRVHFVIE